MQYQKKWKQLTSHTYMKPELEMPKNTEWQEQISHNSVPDALRSLLWSLQGQIVKESSNITKYSTESGDLWWSLWSFWQNGCSNSETNLTCITVTSQCDQYVATVINHWHLNHGLWLVNDLHTHRSLWICCMSHGHVHKVMEHVILVDDAIIIILN